MSNGDSPFGQPSLLAIAVGSIQTVIGVVLTYISRVIRDVRTSQNAVEKIVAQHDVKLEESEKRQDERSRDVHRRLERLEHRVNKEDDGHS